MSTRFTEILADACNALHEALSACGIEDVERGILHQVGDREFRFEQVAAAHFASAAVRRIVVGCAHDVARAVGATTGMLALAEAYRAALARRRPELTEDRRRFLSHDPRHFRVHAAGARNFHYRVPVAAGAVDLVIDLEPRRAFAREFHPERGTLPDAFVDIGDDRAVTRPETLRAIFARLAKQEADIRIKLGAGKNRYRFLPATVLDTASDAGRCVITAAEIPHRTAEAAAAVGDTVDLVFSVHGRLLEGAGRVVQVSTGILDDGLALPLLELELPHRLTFGQRRGARRIVPRDRIRGELQRLDADGEPIGTGLPFRVLDLSFTGLRATLAGSALLSRLKWSAPVLCRLELPADCRAVALLARVRRLLLPPDEGRRQSAIVAIEFSDASGGEDLDYLRRFLAGYGRDELGDDLGGEVAVEPIGADIAAD